MIIRRYRKVDLEFAIGIIVFNIIILSNFFDLHYATDTYCIIESGFSYTARNAFLWSGRPITAVVFYLADLLNVNMNTHIFIMACLSIITLSASVYILFKTIINLKKSYEKGIILTLLIVSYVTVINFCTMDFLVFAEMGILCTGVLFSIMAACEIKNESKYKYIKIVFFAVMGALCYQAVLNIYVPLAIMIVAIKDKDNIKKALKEAFFILMIYSVAIIFSLMLSNTINSLIKLGTRPTIVPNIEHIIKTYVKYLENMVIYTFNIGPKYWYISIIGVITIIYFLYIFISKSKKVLLFYYLSILLSTIFIPLLPLIVQEETKQYLEPRMALSFGASIGIMLLFYICSIKKEDRIMIKIISTISLIMFISNCQYIVNSSAEMKATNLLDRNYADAILCRINNYEKRNNQIITYIAIDYDASLEFYYHGSKTFRCLNAKALSVDWAIVGVLKTYGNRDFILKKVPEEIHDKYFEGKNWNTYSEEQIQFEGDTMYICIY